MLNSIFRKKEKKTSLKKNGTNIENQTEEPIDQGTVNLFDIPDSIIPHVFNYAYIGIAPLNIDIR
mgnify:CR=1 FL=1